MIETVKIKNYKPDRAAGHDWLIINARDFDPGVHERYRVAAEESVPAAGREIEAIHRGSGRWMLVYADTGEPYSETLFSGDEAKARASTASASRSR